MNWLSFDELKNGMKVWVKLHDTHKATKATITAVAGMIPLLDGRVLFPVAFETKDKRFLINYTPCRFYKYKYLLEKDKKVVEV